MKIGITSFNAPWDLMGGVETHAWEIAKALSYLGNEVHFFFAGPTNKNKEENNVQLHQIKVYWCYKLPHNKLRVNLPLYNFAVHRKVKKTNLDVFHSQNFDGLTLLPTSAPTIITIHTTPFIRYLYAKKKKNIPNVILTFLEHYKCKFYADKAIYIAVSEKVQQELEDIYTIESTVILNGVNEPEIVPQDIAKEKLGISQWDKVILFFSRVTREKAPHKLLEVLEKNNGVNLLVGGGGDFIEELKKMVKEKKLQNRVKVLGYIKPEEKKYIFSAADCFALPSDQIEGQPITILEAMSYGLPCYVRDLRWVPSYLRKFAVSGDIEEGIMKTLQRGKQNIPVMTWRDVAKKLERIYEKLIERKNNEK